MHETKWQLCAHLTMGERENASDPQPPALPGSMLLSPQASLGPEFQLLLFLQLFSNEQPWLHGLKRRWHLPGGDVSQQATERNRIKHTYV